MTWTFQRIAARQRSERAKSEQRHLRFPRQRQADLSRYVPIDEILSSPSTRLLRALRWFDWVSVGDLFLAMEIDVIDTEQARYRAALQGLVNAGRAERQGGARSHTYRLTPAGRAEINNRLRRAA